MTAVFPEGVPAEGAISILFVPALADAEAPTATVLNGATAVNLSCYIKSGGFTKESSQNSIEDRRFCSTTSAEQPGRITKSYGDLIYVYDPQAATGDPNNEAYETLAPGTTGFLVERWGVLVEVPFAAGQFVDIAPVKWGDRRKQSPPDTEGSVLTVAQKPFVTGAAFDDVAVV